MTECTTIVHPQTSSYFTANILEAYALINTEQCNQAPILLMNTEQSMHGTTIKIVKRVF